ncbi:MAG: carbon starvation protein A, partial [Deferribacteres bacterium]|nr:carbon starvation protein A [Deferribacteres bacterium]
LSIFLGKFYPIKAAYHVWMIVFFFYIIIAASIPVHVLLQPRDYMNAWLLVGGLILGGLAVIFSFKPVNMPAFTSFSPKIVAGQNSPFWPVVVLIIACGSLSGFHSLVASGTSSKQLSKEVEGLFVGYGSMLAEGFLSTLVIACIAAYGYSILSPDVAAALKSNFAANILKAEKSVGGPVGFFSKSYGAAVSTVLGLPREFMVILATMWVAAFAMTTLDTTNRLARYTLTELFEPFKETSPGLFGFFTNRWVASAVPALIGVALAWTGAWHVIWPAFGGANQMLASIALLTAAAWVTKVQKRHGIMVVLPAMFLWITVTAALIWYLIVAVPTFYAKNHVQAGVLALVVLVMLVLNLVLLFDYLTSKGEDWEGYEAK